jgi:hypothetical protein
MATTICTGSLMDGLTINLGEYAGIENLSDSEEETLWSEHSDISIVEQCSHAELVVTGELDEMPGQSDEFYELEASDIKAFKDELKQVIESIIKR